MHRARHGRDWLAAHYYGSIAATAFLLGILCLWPIPAIGNDASLFTVIGRAWLTGGLPYRDIIDFKPPLAFLVDGLGGNLGLLLGVGTIGGVRLAAAAAAGLAAVAVAGLARSYGVRSSIAAVFGLGAALILSAYQFAAGGGLSEPPALALALASWALVEGGRSPRRLLGAGLLGGLGLGCSLMALPILAGTGLAVLEPLWHRRWRIGLRDGAWALLGAGLAWGPLILVFAVGGALDGLWNAVFAYNSVYGFAACRGALGTCSASLVLPATYALAILPLVALAIIGLRHDRRWRPIAALSLAALVSFLVLRRVPSDHYWWSAYIGSLLMGAIGLEAICRRMEDRIGRHAALLALAVFAPTALFSVSATLAAAPIYPFWGEATHVARIVERQPAGPLFLWGNPTSLYVLADRAPASRFPDTWGLGLPGYTSAAAVQQACEDLVATRALVVLDSRGAPDLTGDAALAPGLQRSWYAPLGRLLARDWQPVGAYGPLQVLSLRPGASPVAADCQVEAP